jgi:hypothetical protein
MLRRLLARLRGRSPLAVAHERLLDARAGYVDGKIRTRGRYVDYEADSKPPPHYR